jgi:hypothetical protein
MNPSTALRTGTDEHGSGRSAQRVSVTLALAAALIMGPSEAPGAVTHCTGDCNADEQVTVDELLLGVSIALGEIEQSQCPELDANGDSRVTVDELVAAVAHTLRGCGGTPTPTPTPTTVPERPIQIEGVCKRPGPSGLEDCAAGTRIAAWDCAERSRCLRERGGSNLLGEGFVTSQGDFALTVDESRVRNGILLEAELADATVYRLVSFPVAARSATGKAAGVAQIIIDPSSEAGVRLLDENGLENYIDRGVSEVIGRSRAANVTTNFAGLSASEGATVATETARETLAVRDAVESNRILRSEIAVSTAIDPVGDLDLFGFHLDSTGPLLLEVTRAAGALRPCLEVRPLGSIDPVAGGRNCAFSHSVRLELMLEAGTYTVVVSDSSRLNTGPYTLLLLRLSDGHGTVLEPEQEVEDELEFAGDLDLYRFSLEAAAPTILEVTRAAGALRPCLEVRPLGSIDPVAGGRNCAFSHSVRLELMLEAGTYTVVVSDSSRLNTGRYTLILLPLILP